MIIVFSDSQKKDLAFLKDQSVEVLSEFCKLTMGYIRKGDEGSRKVFLGASKKLGVKVNVIEAAISALSFLFSEATKLNLKEQDFVDSVLIMAFPDSHNAVLKEVYLTNKAEIRSLLSDLSVDLPHYSNLEWRLDFQLSSRTSRNILNPIFLIELETLDKKKSHTEVLQADWVNLKHLCLELESALDTTKEVYARRVSRNL